MESAWFYTLSTIPQTLGAIIALVGAFVVFKLNIISVSLSKDIESIKRFLLPLFPEKEIHDIEKMDKKEISFLLSKGVERLDSSKNDLGFTNIRELQKLYREVIMNWERSFNPRPDRIYAYLLQKNNNIKHLIKIKKETLNYFISSLMLTLIPIVFSLLFLPFYSEDLSIYQSFHDFILSLLIGLAITSVLYTAYSLWKIARF